MMELRVNEVFKEFRSFRQENKFLDCDLKCQDEIIRCHKLVLFCFSPTFRHLLTTLEPLEEQTVTFLLPEVSLCELKSFLDALYANLGSADDEDTDHQLDLELANLFGFIDFNPVSDINFHRFMDVQFKVKDELEEDDSHGFDEDAFQSVEDYGGDTRELRPRKRKATYRDKRAKATSKAIKYSEDEANFFVGSFGDTLEINEDRARPSKAKFHKSKGDMRKKPKKEVRTFQCRHCPLVSKGKTNHTKHIYQVHYPELKVQVSCRHCKKEMSLYAFRKHVQKHEVIICDECGKTLANRSRLQVHIRKKHLMFKCEICGKELAGHRAFETHRANEHFKDSYSCEICGKRFGSHGQIVVHKHKTHRAEESLSFKCDYCDRRFATFTKRLNHMHSIHLKDYPFHCRYGCGAKYNDTNNLAKHEKQKHGKAYPIFHGFEHLRPPTKKK